MNLLGFLHILEVTSAVLDSCQGIYRQEKIRRRQKSCNMAKNINKDLLSLRTPTRRFAPRWLVPSSSSPLPSTHRITSMYVQTDICMDEPNNNNDQRTLFHAVDLDKKVFMEAMGAHLCLPLPAIAASGWVGHTI